MNIKENMMGIIIPFVTSFWNISTPTLFRYMDKKHVDDFFKDGSIRISSFDQFRKHKDEQRLDKGEGRIMLAHNLPAANEGKGQAVNAWVLYDKKAYILSTSIKFDKKLMKSFNTDSYLRIHDSTNFGMEIAKKIPGLTAAFEGFCLYQTNKILRQDLHIDLKQFQKQPDKKVDDLKKIKPLPGLPDGQIDNEEYDIEKLQRFLVNNAQHYPLFMKDKSFIDQVEYRFVWLTNIEPVDFIDIKIPEAIRHCSEPNWLVE